LLGQQALGQEVVLFRQRVGQTVQGVGQVRKGLFHPGRRAFLRVSGHPPGQALGQEPGVPPGEPPGQGFQARRQVGLGLLQGLLLGPSLGQVHEHRRGQGGCGVHGLGQGVQVVGQGVHLLLQGL